MENECICCLEQALDALDCGHFIHRECIIKSSKLECPICKQELKIELTQNEEIVLNKSKDEYQTYIHKMEDDLSYDAINQIYNDYEYDTIMFLVGDKIFILEQML